VARVSTMVIAIPFLWLRDGTHPLAAGICETPASCPGRADQAGTAGGCQKTWAPAGRSIRRTARTGVSRFAGQAGTQAPDPTPLLSQDRGSRAGSTTHTLPADSVRTMISCSWRTGAYRSSSSAYCGRLIERFGVALPLIPLGLHKGAVCKTVGFSRRDPRRGPDLIHCRIRPYMNQGGAAGAPATGLCVGTPARHGRAAVAEAPQISRSHPSCYRCYAGPSSPLLIVQLVATASMAVLRAVARDRLRRPLTRRPVCGVLPAASLVSATADYDRPAPSDDRSTRHVCPAAVTGDEPIPCCSGPYQCDDYAYAPVPGASCSPPPPVCGGGLPKGWPLRLRVAVYALQLAASLGLRPPVA